jgi:hypothetical protein
MGIAFIISQSPEPESRKEITAKTKSARTSLALFVFADINKCGCGLKSMIVTVVKNELHGSEMVLLLFGKARSFSDHSAVTGSQT